MARSSTRFLPGPAHRNFRGTEIAYNTMHWRLRQSRGSASTHVCAHCGSRALDWAYDGEDLSEKIDPRSGCVYSTDPERYEPLCRKCHIATETGWRVTRRAP